MGQKDEHSITKEMIDNWEDLEDGWTDFNGVTQEGKNLRIKLNDGSYAVVRVVDDGDGPSPALVAVVAKTNYGGRSKRAFVPVWVDSKYDEFEEILKVIGFRKAPVLGSELEFSLEEMEIAEKLIIHQKGQR